MSWRVMQMPLCHKETRAISEFQPPPPNHTLKNGLFIQSFALYTDIKQRDWDSTQRALKRETGSEKTEHAGK